MVTEISECSSGLRYLCDGDYSRYLTPLERNYSRDIGECLNCVTHNVMYSFVNDEQHYEITIMERLL